MFDRAVITAKGLALDAKIIAGKTNAVFTAIRLGNGTYNGTEDLNAATAMKSVKQTFGISSISIAESNTVRLRSVINNVGIKEGYYISEVGIYAQDPDAGEILYSIALGIKNKMDYQPSESELEGATSTFDIYTVISNTEKATIRIGTGAMASAKDVEALQKEKVDINGGEISETIINTVENIDTKFPVPNAGEKTKVFLGKVKKCLDDLVSSESSAITNDDIDNLDELVYIPKFKNSDVLVGGDNNTHPAFIVNGVEIPGFYYSKYQNVVKTVDGVSMAYSLYGKDPAVNTNFDNARARCEAKGRGYHLSTMVEWAAIALWCKKNGFMPYGNNYYGKDTRETDYIAIPTSQDGDKTGRVATGTGPVKWSHDETPSGIWDLNGNVYEWQGGLRIVWGEVQILENNNAANPDNSQSATSTQWKAINAADGTLVEPESKITDTAAKTSGNTVKLDFVSNIWTYSTGITSSTDQSRSCIFGRTATAASISDTAKSFLRMLALLPDSGASESVYEGDYFWACNGVSEQLVYRGGRWSNNTSAGIFSVNVATPRSNASTVCGFRFTYIPELES